MPGGLGRRGAALPGGGRVAEVAAVGGGTGRRGTGRPAVVRGVL